MGLPGFRGWLVCVGLALRLGLWRMLVDLLRAAMLTAILGLAAAYGVPVVMQI